jgi:hypothetical protein
MKLPEITDGVLKDIGSLSMITNNTLTREWEWTAAAQRFAELLQGESEPRPKWTERKDSEPKDDALMQIQINAMEQVCISIRAIAGVLQAMLDKNKPERLSDDMPYPPGHELDSVSSPLPMKPEGR